MDLLKDGTTLTITEDGAFRWDHEIVDVVVNPVTGTVEVEGDQLTMTFDNRRRHAGPITFRFEIRNDVLSLRAAEGIEWRLDRDGTVEDAVLVIVLERISTVD